MISISLTTPWSPGDLEPGASYDKVFISGMSLDKITKTLRYGLYYGLVDSGAPAIKRILRNYELKGEDYNILLTEESEGSGEVLLDELERMLLQKALDEGVVAGTIG